MPNKTFHNFIQIKNDDLYLAVIVIDSAVKNKKTVQEKQHLNVMRIAVFCYKQILKAVLMKQHKIEP